MPPDRTSPNFDFLGEHDEQLVRIAALAERYFQDDPNTCFIKLRQFSKLLSQQLAARTGLFASSEESQSDLLRRLKLERAAPSQVFGLFHQLRIAGNRAAHDHLGDRREALAGLKIARQLSIWFHRIFGGDPAFTAGAFVPPPDPTAATVRLKEELDRLRAERKTLLGEAEKAREHAEMQTRARESAEEKARRESEEKQVLAQLAQEADEHKAAVITQLAALQEAAIQAPAQEKQKIASRAEEAADQIDLDEAATRAIIDQQLRDCGWEADTDNLRHANGSRPAKGLCYSYRRMAHG